MQLKIKIKINKWDYIELKSFCTANDQLNEKALTEWEKTFVNHIPNKRLISKKICRTHTSQ